MKLGDWRLPCLCHVSKQCTIGSSIPSSWRGAGDGHQLPRTAVAAVLRLPGAVPGGRGQRAHHGSACSGHNTQVCPLRSRHSLILLPRVQQTNEPWLGSAGCHPLPCRHQPLSVTLPNAYNFAFDYHFACVALVAIYLPGEGSILETAFLLPVTSLDFCAAGWSQCRC